MIRKLAACLLTFSWLAAASAIAQGQGSSLQLVQSDSGDSAPPDLDVPYVTSPSEVVQKMLDMGHVGPGDYVMDLGSGDGRIVIGAVQRGAFGLGVDIDPQRVREARDNAERAGVSDRVSFLQQDLFKTDISRASAVMMYLLPEVNLKLRPTLLEDLRPGTRVVSHSFNMGDWQPDNTVYVDQGESATTHTIYMWVIPADAAGQWQWTLDGQDFSWQIEQQYQELDTQLRAGGSSIAPEDVELNGRRIGFVAEHRDKRYIFSGRLEGDRIDGTVHVRTGDEPRVLEWTARRQ